MVTSGRRGSQCAGQPGLTQGGRGGRADRLAASGLLPGKGHFSVTSCGHDLRHVSELRGLPCQKPGRREDMRLPACKRSKIISMIEICL
jgi:hypothetical protein